MNAYSKSLGHDDASGFEFAKEMLAGDVTAAINFDRLQRRGDEYIIFEYLLCEEEQDKKHKVNTYNSHPNRYAKDNLSKFVGLCTAAEAFGAILYLVNYAKKGTKHEDKILLMKVVSFDFSDPQNPKIETKDSRFNREGFSRWFRKLNRECLK